MCIIDCLSTIVFILPLYLDDTKVIILILWRRTFQLEYWRTFQLVSTRSYGTDNGKTVCNQHPPFHAYHLFRTLDIPNLLRCRMDTIGNFCPLPLFLFDIPVRLQPDKRRHIQCVQATEARVLARSVTCHDSCVKPPFILFPQLFRYQYYCNLQSRPYGSIYPLDNSCILYFKKAL